MAAIKGVKKKHQKKTHAKPELGYFLLLWSAEPLLKNLCLKAQNQPKGVLNGLQQNHMNQMVTAGEMHVTLSHPFLQPWTHKSSHHHFTQRTQEMQGTPSGQALRLTPRRAV